MHEISAITGDDALVMAMPRRELYPVQGFVQNVSMSVIESLAEESWFATPDVLADDVEAKIVRLGLVIERDDQVLVHEDGAAVHACAVPPEVTQLADGVRGIRRFAALAASRLLSIDDGAPVLVGYVNNDSVVALRPFFLLVYRLIVDADVAAPPQHSWIGRDNLRHCPLDAASAAVCHVLHL